MRRVIALCLLFSIAFQVMGYSMVCHSSIYWQKKEMKKRIKQGLPASELKTFEFTKEAYENLLWMKEGKEFSLNGHLYDIVYKKEVEGKIEVQCINDTQEEILFAHLDEQVSLFMDVQKKGNAKTKHLLKLVKIQAELPLDPISLYAFSNSTELNNRISNQPRSIHLEFFIPPEMNA